MWPFRSAVDDCIVQASNLIHEGELVKFRRWAPLERDIMEHRIGTRYGDVKMEGNWLAISTVVDKLERQIPDDVNYDAFRYMACGFEHLGIGEINMKPNYGIRNVKKCKLGKKTTVWLDDGRKGEAKVQGGDEYDPYVAFSLAYTAAQFESKTAFRNFVDKMTKKNKRYGVYVKGKKLKPLEK